MTNSPSPMFREREIVSNPRVILRMEIPPKDFYFKTKKLVGDYYKVIPHNGREVLFLQMLGKNVDMYLPESGEGLLVTKRVIDNM